MSTLYQQQSAMRLRQKPRPGRPNVTYSDDGAELQLRVRYAYRWLKQDVTIEKIADEMGRPRWWARDWVRAGCPLFDLLADFEGE